MVQLEICIDSVESAIAAQQGGANRVELCSALFEGGLTPSVGMLKCVLKAVSVPVFVMIRPRGGDFLYSELERAVMHEDVVALKAAGAHGIVLGALNADGTIDVDFCRALIAAARPLPVTFHRAFDMSRNLEESMSALISLGVERVLTSGMEATAFEGCDNIRAMIAQAEGSGLIVVPGGGITERNLPKILKTTGATECHCSARQSYDSRMVYRNTGVFMGGTLRPPEFSTSITHAGRVAGVVAAARLAQ
ncbi:cutc protein [Capsaspora owczarzaki ATCC 30864]|uniref:Copper homeostasis protein cutC homolog n=1 Tax=Capsaspora owczarzaki (strain ATCC 30864) TaxID=595528 RepID=A0A0D2UE88_CAPO3|nr:cutc protein [Capsaspora owczarzaki ATCC 30864]KJE93441.1 cutc protein [Capsaspora owczarzaki ATCC 30864]|eukprot:XP_004348058.1 cutc protein [Capsaspora owczarzaki ATCC 30864]